MYLYWISLAINIIFILALIFVIFVFLLPPFLGAPYVPTPKKTVAIMVGLANIKAGERAVDLGSGDGRIVVALARAGAQAHGYEINPLLVLASRLRVRRAGLKDKAFIHWRNFLNLDFSQFDVITIYGLTGLMKKLEHKFKSQMRPQARLVSHAFHFPNWPVSRQEGVVFLYRK